MADSKSDIKKIYRSENDRVIAGIAGGLGDYFKIDAIIFRIFFILLTLFGGAGVPLYLILWLIIPSQSNTDNDHQKVIKGNAQEIKNKAQALASDFRSSKGRDISKQIFGIILLIIGLSFLLDNFGFYVSGFIWKLWPVLLIVIGYLILVRDERK